MKYLPPNRYGKQTSCSLFLSSRYNILSHCKTFTITLKYYTSIYRKKQSRKMQMNERKERYHLTDYQPEATISIFRCITF